MRFRDYGESFHARSEAFFRANLPPGIGMTRFEARLFEDIAWSTGGVFAQTLERAAEIGVDPARMPQCYDVDDAASLARLEDELRGHRAPVAPGPFRARHSRARLCPGSASVSGIAAS